MYVSVCTELGGLWQDTVNPRIVGKRILLTSSVWKLCLLENSETIPVFN